MRVPSESGDKGSSLYRADLKGCFKFPWLELGPLCASNNNSLRALLLSLSCLAGQTRNFDGNFCTPECIDICHFPGTEPTIQPALGWTPVGLTLYFLSLPPMCGCLIQKGQSLQRVCLRRNEQFPALSLNPSQTNKQQKSSLKCSSFPRELLQNAANAELREGKLVG